MFQDIIFESAAAKKQKNDLDKLKIKKIKNSKNRNHKAKRARCCKAEIQNFQSKNSSGKEQTTIAEMQRNQQILQTGLAKTS